MPQSLFGTRHQLPGDFIAKIILTTVLSDFCRGVLEDNGGLAALQGHGNVAGMGFAVFADHALHFSNPLYGLVYVRRNGLLACIRRFSVQRAPRH